MTARIIYCFDAYCGWCYGFSPVIERFWKNYKSRLDFEVLSGGMIMPERPVPISTTAGYIRNAYRKVEELTGVAFGADYLWHIYNPDKSDWYPHSEKPATALAVFKEYSPAEQVAFAVGLQYALHKEGRDLCDNEAYRNLLETFSLPVDEFYRKLGDKQYVHYAHQEFDVVRKLRVTGFPSVFLQVNEAKFYLLAEGFTNYDTLAARTDTVLSEMSKNAE